MKKFLNPKFWVSRFFFYLGISLPVRVGVTEDVYIRLDPLSVPHALWVNPKKKRHDIEVIEHLIQKNDVCIDVGANVGHLALVMAKKSGGQVFAIEPGKRMYESMLKNISLNGYTNITAFRAVVHNNDGEVDFYEYGHADTFSSTVQAKHASAAHYKVPSVSLHSFMEKHAISHVDFLKIDVEGAELQVLTSLRECINRVKNIYFEYSESNYKNFGYQGSEVITLLKNTGFDVQEVIFDEKGELLLRPTGHFSDNNYLAVNINYSK